MPPALRSTIPGTTASARSCTPRTFSCTWAFSPSADRATRLARTLRCPRWRTGSRCCGRPIRRRTCRVRHGSARSTGRTSTVTPYCAVIRSASVLSTSSRRAVMIRWCPRDASSMASASPMFCDAPVTTARASALGAGTGMRRTISWAPMSEPRSSAPAARRSQVLCVGAVGFRLDGLERGRRDLRVLDLSDQRRRRRSAR